MDRVSSGIQTEMYTLALSWMIKSIIRVSHLFSFIFQFNYPGTYFDLQNQMKIREEYTRGKRTNFVKTPCSIEELNQQVQNPGYVTSKN